VHADCFRLRSLEEFELAGLEDWLGEGAVLLVEWGDRFEAALGDALLELRFSERADGARDISARALGAVAEATLARWSAACR
jgi:tRNA A37 threonylcarbamoyladenosine biosynthesis protein TsaE